MKYTIADYQKFLNTELEAQIKDYEQLVMTKALILKEKGIVFVAQFLKINDSGIAIFKIRYSDIMPRKNSFWTASYLVGEKGSFKTWGNDSWAELRDKYQGNFSEAYCAWLSKTDTPEFYLIGIKGLSIEFIQLLEEGKTIIAFGPQDPPLKYLENLIDIVASNHQKINLFLSYEEKENLWNPKKIEAKDDFTEHLLYEMEKNDCVIVQGPPGTGKTYRIAQFITHLLKKNKSVLVTALTNQALIELAKKECLQILIKEEKVSKASLTIDEHKEIPLLQSITNNFCKASNGHLTLATFYVASSWAKEAKEVPFDYVIMDEASQALLPMIAATLKLGKKIVWIGDQNQLSPIILTNEDVINTNNYSSIVKGFKTLCENYLYKSFMFSDSFRLTSRAASFTGFFYNNLLRSVTEKQKIPIDLSYLNKEGGPSLVEMDLEIGSKTPKNAFDFIYNLTLSILDKSPKANVAILSKFKDSIRELQRVFIGVSNDNVKIETVDRVQGLTVDYCLFFIPNVSVNYSLDKELFNVATSRARFCTVIISDKSLFNNNMAIEVRKYLLKTQEDKFISFEPKIITSGNVSISVVDKINLTAFQKKKNVYIIDTNIFIDEPNIISKIEKTNKIIIPAKVLEELDNLKIKSKGIDKRKINEAAKNINMAFSQKRSTMEDADTNLLPKSFDKKNPDCLILSVALKFKDENPVLLTSDNVLQTRAKGLDVKTISLKEFNKTISFTNN